MLLIRSEGIIERILMAPRMESAEIRKRYPSRIEITVKERTTVAYLPYGGFFIDLDAEARAIGVSEAITDPNVPIITGMTPTFVLLGGAVEPGAQARLASMLGSKLSEGKVPGISEVNVKDMQDIVIITNDGSRIMLGASDGIEVRLAMALDILSGARARKQAFKYIDVRVAERPVLGTK
jgi:cell division protein FtsQ